MPSGGGGVDRPRQGLRRARDGAAGRRGRGHAPRLRRTGADAGRADHRPQPRDRRRPRTRRTSCWRWPTASSATPMRRSRRSSTSRSTTSRSGSAPRPRARRRRRPRRRAGRRRGARARARERATSTSPSVVWAACWRRSAPTTPTCAGPGSSSCGPLPPTPATRVRRSPPGAGRVRPATLPGTLGSGLETDRRASGRTATAETHRG